MNVRTLLEIEKAIETLGFKDCHNLRDLQKIAQQEKITILDLIKKRYKKQAILLHPDKNPSKDTTQEMATLSNDYELLQDEIAQLNPNESAPYHFTSVEPSLSKEWREHLSSVDEKYHAKRISLLELIPHTIHIYDRNSSEDKSSMLYMQIRGRTLSLYFHFNPNARTVNPSLFYATLIQLILEATNGQSLLIGLTNKKSRENSSLHLINDVNKQTQVGPMLLATFEENGAKSALCIKNNLAPEHLKILCDLLGLKWIICGSLITLDHPDIPMGELEKLTHGGHLISKYIQQLLELPSPSVSTTLAISSVSHHATPIELAKNEMTTLLHDGIQSKSPNLTSGLLSQKIHHLDARDQITLLGDIFISIQQAISTRYTHIKSHLLDKSGRDIANEHIKILKDKLIDIIKAHTNPSMYRDKIEDINVKKLIDYDRDTSAEKNDGETNTRQVINKLLQPKTHFLSVGYKQ